MSQPVVSKVISDLERTLKVRLVDRTMKGVELTVYGSALLRRGTIVFDELGHSVKEIEFLADPTAGEVRIASIEALNSTFLPAVIHRVSRKFPRLSFRRRQQKLVQSNRCKTGPGKAVAGRPVASVA